MTKLRGVTILLIFLVIGLSFIGLLFIDGKTSNITVDTGSLINKYKNSSSIFDFLFEYSGYAQLHHIKNYLLFEYFTSSGLVKLGEYTNNIRIMDSYLGVILKGLGWAALWEVVEKFMVWVIQVAYLWFGGGMFLWLKNFFGTGEDIWNTLLSDLPQSLSTHIGGTFLYYTKCKKPEAFLLYKKSRLRISLTFSWVGISGVMGILQSIKKDFGLITIPFGFFAFYSLEVFFTGVIYVSDLYLIEKHKNDKDILTKEEVDDTFTETLIYLFFQFVGSWFLLAPGFITSNLFYFFYIFFVYFVKKKEANK